MGVRMSLVALPQHVVAEVDQVAVGAGGVREVLGVVTVGAAHWCRQHLGQRVDGRVGDTQRRVYHVSDRVVEGLVERRAAGDVGSDGNRDQRCLRQAFAESQGGSAHVTAMALRLELAVSRSRR